MASVLAVLAAFANASSSILQRLGVQSAPDGTALNLSLVRYAVRHLVWFVGLALILVGFLLQAVALRFGELRSVQPIVATELLFLVLILGVWFRFPLSWREWLGAAGAALGLATFLVVASPGGGTVVPGLGAWTWAFVAVGGLSALCAAGGFAGPRWFRAAMFGASGSLLFGLSAALTKQLTDLVTEGWGHVFTNWTPYVLVACGAVGLFLIQGAFHAGPITASQTTLTIVDPVSSVLLGVWLFHDHLHTAGWRLPVELLAVVVVGGGVFLLAQSPLVAKAHDSPEGDRLVRLPRPGPDGEVDKVSPPPPPPPPPPPAPTPPPTPVVGPPATG